MLKEHEQIRQYRGGYPFQGLLGIPVGLILVVLLSAWLLWPAFTAEYGIFVAVLLLPVMRLVRFGFRVHYQTKGEVPASALARRAAWLFLVGLLLLRWVFGLLSPAAGIAAEGVWVGLILLVVGRNFPLHRVLAITALAASLLLPFALSGAMTLPAIRVLIWLFYGWAVILASVYEHQAFVSSMAGLSDSAPARHNPARRMTR